MPANFFELKLRLEKSLDFFKSELLQVRTGRANPGLVEDIVVEAYGSKMTVKEVGTITVLDSQNIIVSPWDKGLISSIAKSIRESDLKLNPVEESDRLRIPIPSLTEERRKEFSRVVSTKSEETKNSIRSIRQEAMKDIEKDFNDKKIGEDEKFRLKEEVEKTVKEFVEKVEEIAEHKRQEILRV
jgi:ribosome recycling factor